MKRKLEKGERVFFIVIGIFALICLIASLKLFLAAPTLSGEGTVPLLCSAVMLLMTVISLLEMRGHETPYEDKLPLVGKIKEAFHFLFPGKVGLIMIYCILYVALLSVTGFAVSTFLFLAVSMITLNSQRKIRMLVISGITMVCIIIVFQYIFQVQLP